MKAAAEPPHTIKRPVRIEMHNTILTDPYTWLEDGSNPQVRRWIDAQNGHAWSYLDGISSRTHLREKFAQMEDLRYVGIPYSVIFSHPDYGVRNPVFRYFQFVREPHEEHKVLYFRDGMSGRRKVAVDPHTLSDDGSVTLHEYFPSGDGTKLAFATTIGGTDVTTIHVKDLETGEMLPDKLRNIMFASVAWVENGSGFYYSAWPFPGTHSRPKQASHVFYHKLGTRQSEDVGFFGKGLGAGYICGVDISTDQRTLLIYQSDNINNDVHYIRLKSPTWDTHPLITGLDAYFGVIDVMGKTALVVTDYKAPNGRVVKFNIDHPAVKNWTTVAHEGLPIDWVMKSLHRERLTVGRLDDVYSDVQVYSQAGRWVVGKVHLPFKGAVTFPEQPSGTSSDHFQFGNLVTEDHTYKLDDRTNRIRRLDSNHHYNTSNLQLEQVWYESHDGTRVPMFMVTKKGTKRTEDNPVMLYGYGGFGIASMPEFDHKILPFVNDGGIYAIANIRGGGEFGERWYRGGRHSRQQNSLDDFIAAAEWLQSSGWTNPQRTAIRGRSNGGFLTASVVVQQPELFRAAVVEMPVTDFIGGDKYDISALCRGEFGNPANPHDFRFMMEYAPYWNVKRADYPSVLVITGENDTRTHPMHGRKFAAALQDATTSGNPVLLLTEEGLGHGGSTFHVPKEKNVEITTDYWSFVYRELGMKTTPVPEGRTWSVLRRD